MTEDLQGFVAATAPLVGLELSPEQQAGVAAALPLLLAQAGLVLTAAVPPEIKGAPVFVP
ncbi:MAG TPA: AtzG-like protein [Acetobacteraceae bacterium]|nr:AtzG-like protein [Acetobacteraceae bacterium]